MEYLLLIYDDESERPERTEEESAAAFGEWMAYSRELVEAILARFPP